MAKNLFGKKTSPHEALIRKEYGLEEGDELPYVQLKRARDRLMGDVAWEKGLKKKQLKLLKALNRVLLGRL